MIRPYQPADENALVTILRLNTPGFFAPEEEQDFITYLKHEAVDYFVIEEAGIIIGGGGFNLQKSGKRAHISWDLFHPDFQGKGFGKALTEFRIAKIRKLAAVEKIVVRTSQVAYRFYQKQGFELKEIVKDYWSDGFDLYSMELP